MHTGRTDFTCAAMALTVSSIGTAMSALTTHCQNPAHYRKRDAAHYIPVEVPQVDMVNAELLERALQRFGNVVRLAVDTPLEVAPPVRAHAELGREEDLLALAGALEPLSDQLLVVSVRVGGIPVCDPILVYGIKDLERERGGSVVGDLADV